MVLLAVKLPRKSQHPILRGGLSTKRQGWIELDTISTSYPVVGSATFLIKNQNYGAMPNGNYSVKATD